MQTVLVIFKFFARGGAQRDLIRTAEALLKRNAEVVVLCAEALDPLPAGCKLQLLPVSGMTNHARVCNFEHKVGEYLQKNPAGAVLGFGRMKHLDLYFAADDCLKIRWKNALMNFLNPRRRTFLQLERSALASPVVLTLTARQERDYRHFYQLPPEKFKRLPPGIDRKYQTFERSEALRKTLRSKFNIPAENFLLVQAAASFNTKGVDRSLAAIGELPEQLKSKITFIVAGDDRRREKYCKLPKMMNIDARFPGGLDDLEELYTAADLMLHPARNEATGTVLIEALCCQLPVLTTARCGYAEYVSAAGGGVVLPENFVLEQWVLALKKLLSEPEHLEQCRKNLQDLYKNNFWYSRADAVAEELINFARKKGNIES